MAFMVSATRWLWRAARSTEAQTNFNTYIWADQILNLFFVCLVSIVLFAIDIFQSNPTSPIYVEVIALALGTIANFKLSPEHKLRSVITFYVRVITLGALCLIGWAITAGIAYSLVFILKTIMVMNHNDYFLIAFMITGALWCAPPMLLYRKILHTEELRPNLKGNSFNKFLWPLLFAYLSLLIPLLAQDIANSEKWRKMTNAKPIKSVQVDMYQHTQIFPFV